MEKKRPTSLTGGLKKDPPDNRDYRFTSLPDDKRIYKTAEALPSRIDRMLEMSSVKNQKELGACVAFAACALKEWQEKKEYDAEVVQGATPRKEEPEYNFSEQWVYWNCKKIDPWPDEQGTNFRSALKVLHKIGVPIEAAWPYSDNPIDIGEPSKWAHLIAKWGAIDSYWRIEPYIPELREGLAESPVLIGIPCFEEIYGDLVDGIIPYPADPNQSYGDHAVLAIGYDDDTERITIKNSWSKLWGAEGYGYLPYRYVDDFASDFWMAKDMSVTPDMLKQARSLIEEGE